MLWGMSPSFRPCRFVLGRDAPSDHKVSLSIGARAWALQSAGSSNEMGSKKRGPVRPCREHPLNLAWTS